jgi:5-methyltetrahydrofolate--homocysteine methyltransferase
MIVVGEKINSTRKKIKEALDGKRIDILMDEVRGQLSCGVEYIDINTAAGIWRERDDLMWLLENIQARFDCGLSIDSPDSSIVKDAIPLCAKKPFVNSITGETGRLLLLSDLMSSRECFVIVLAMDDNGVPDDIAGRVSIAEKIIDFAVSRGIDKDNIFIDPLAKPVSTEPNQAAFFLESVRLLKDKGIRCIGGLSNVSFGLPKRHILNAVFIKLALTAGIDAAIIDPTQAIVKDLLCGKPLPEEISSIAEDVILGKDEYSMNYIKAFRQGRLDL